MMLLAEAYTEGYIGIGDLVDVLSGLFLIISIAL